MKNKITSIVFGGLLISMAISNVILPAKSFSSKENRYLQLFPKWSVEDGFSGKFGTSFEKYTTDQFIGRDAWISLKTISDLAVLKKDNGRVYFGKDGYLFDVDDKINEDQALKNIANINKLLDTIKEKHSTTDVYALLLPSKSQVLVDKLPAYAPVINEEAIVENLEDKLNDNINILSLIQTLKDKSNEEIYYKTDHHWTTTGAYYSYAYFMESKGEVPLSKDDFIVSRVSSDFLGTSYRKANYYSGNPDKIEIYKPIVEIKYDITINQTDEGKLYEESFLSKTDKYSYFLGGDKAIVDIKTSIDNDKTILIVKDSYANSMVPFLLNHYERIIVVDPRYFNISIQDFIIEEEVDEVLYLFNIQNLIQEKTLR
jgi:hypothetical protein